MHTLAPQPAPGVVHAGQTDWQQFLLLEQVFAERQSPRLTLDFELLEKCLAIPDQFDAVEYFAQHIATS